VLVTGVGMCAYRAIPEKTKSVRDFVGKGAIDLTVLNELRENVPTVGIVGIEDTGKTTLVRKLHHSEDKPKDTTRVQAYVLETIDTKVPYALLDGAGNLTS
jgi:GTP1/Obg family GTP-binding protein